MNIKLKTWEYYDCVCALCEIGNDRAWTVKLLLSFEGYMVREIGEMDLERSLGLKWTASQK